MSQSELQRLRSLRNLVPCYSVIGWNTLRWVRVASLFWLDRSALCNASKNLTITTKCTACRNLFIFLCDFVLDASGSDEKPTAQVRQETPAAMCFSVHTCAFLLSDFNEDWRIVDKLLLSLPIPKTTLLRLLIPDDGGNTLLRNVPNYLPHCTIRHLRWFEFLSALLWEPRIFHSQYQISWKSIRIFSIFFNVCEGPA